MAHRIGRFTLLVNDYTEALAFYVDKLGFEVITDQRDGEHRFVHIGYGAQFPVGLWLWEATGEMAALVGDQSGSHPLLVIYTADCVGLFFDLQEKGVVFVNEPVQTATEVYVHALDLYGNGIVFVEMLESGNKH